jgi:hypothetical protein
MRKIRGVREPSPSPKQSIINNTTYNALVVQGGDYVNGDKIIHNHPPEPAPDTQTPEADTLTDAECIQRLADTGFIKQNLNIKNKKVYAKARTVTVPRIYQELVSLTGDSDRAKRIMKNNISGVEAALNTYLSRITKNDKT